MKKVLATILLWIGCAMGFVLVFLAAVYVHENWRSLEAPAVFIFLALGVTCGIVALRTRAPLAEKIIGGMSIGCLGLSAGFAAFHGWKDAVSITLGLAGVAYFVGVVWFVRRTLRRLRPASADSTLQRFGEPSEQAILADAADPYILYPAKWKIARTLLILLIITAVFGAGASLMLTLKDVRLIVAGFLLACLAALCGLTCLLLVIRLISRKPALMVTHLGLIDGASALYTGAGPIWWEEIANVTIYTTPKAFLRPRYRYLDITPMDARSLLRRQSKMRRFLLRLYSPIPFIWLDIRIPAWMFSPPLETVLEQIEVIAWGDKARQF